MGVRMKRTSENSNNTNNNANQQTMDVENSKKSDLAIEEIVPKKKPRLEKFVSVMELDVNTNSNSPVNSQSLHIYEMQDDNFIQDLPDIDELTLSHVEVLNTIFHIYGEG